jgi:long-chain fatty acid transport protein
MQRHFHRHPVALSLAALPFALALALGGQDAQASGFQLKENSAQGLGRAFAGGAAAPDDCSVVVNNPAAMSDLGDKSCFQADLNVINFSTKFHGSGTDLLGRPLTGGDGGNGGLTKPVPAMYYTRPINDRWTIGASLNVPFGFQTEFDTGWAGRYDALLSKLESIDLNFSTSFKLNDQFSLGGSVIAQRTSAELTQAIDFGTILAVPTNGALLPQEADGFGGLRGDDWGYGFIVGALWKPTEADRIGVNFHSKIDHTISGDGTFLVPSNIQPLLGGRFVNNPGHAEFTTPWFVSGSWWHTVNDRLSLGLDVSYTHWSSFKDLTVHYANPLQPDSVSLFDWHDTWFFSVGGDYRLNDQWTLRAGVAYDRSPTHIDTRTPRVPDGHRTWVAFGAGYKMSEQLKFDAGFVHLFVKDGDIDHTSATFSRLTGRFKNSGNVLGISGQYLF